MADAKEELEALSQQLQQHRGGVPPYDTLRSFLRVCREARMRNPEEPAKYGSLLLKHYRHKLPEEELWLLHEQVATALMEVGALPAALGLVKDVLLRFPDSVRAKRLQGLYYEASGRPERAEQLYRDVLSSAPHNEVLPKRLAAMHRGAGALGDAIDVLTTYLGHYSNDRDAWEELADVYLEACMYRQAAFCLEEVLTMGPLAPGLLVKYADVLASIGGPQQLRAARGYYAKALQVTGGRSVRALYGLVAVANALSDKDAAAASVAAQELPREAAAALADLYAAAAPAQLQAAARAALRRHLPAA